MSISKERLIERTQAWQNKADENLELYQNTGTAVYLARYRKYDEYAQMARQAMVSVDDHEDALCRLSVLRNYVATAKELLDGGCDHVQVNKFLNQIIFEYGRRY